MATKSKMKWAKKYGSTKSSPKNRQGKYKYICINKKLWDEL